MPEVIPYVHFFPQLPYLEAIKKMLTSDALFFYVEKTESDSHSARGVLTTKLFEYLASKKPIIAEINPDSLAAHYINNAGLDVIVTAEFKEMMGGLLKLQAGQVKLKINDQYIQSLSRRIKTRELEQLFNRLNIT